MENKVNEHISSYNPQDKSSMNSLTGSKSHISELITKQIMPENFFKYTSLRLKELGKEIQGLKVKEPVYIERLNEKIPEKRLKTEGDKVIKNGNLFMTEQQGKKKDIKLNDVDKYD